MSGGEMCGKCLTTSDPGKALSPCGRPDCPAQERRDNWESFVKTACQSTDAPYKGRIVEVLAKYNVRLEPAPLDALAMAMERMASRHSQ